MSNPATNRMVSLGTFATKASADRAIAVAQTDQLRGAWVDPGRGRQTLAVYASAWLAQRHDLRSRTAELYEGLLRLHIVPVLGDVEIGRISPASVRSWNSGLLGRGRPGQITVAKAYRLLRTILNTAVADELIARNPCTLKGAGVERSPERPIVTVNQVYELADAMPEHFRALVLLASFGGLRLGELQGLRRGHLDTLHATVTVVEQMQQLRDGSIEVGPPKTDAGNRRIDLPASILPDLQHHLAAYAAAGPDGLVFCKADGTPISRMTLYRAWKQARRVVGIPLRVHDLRHTGNVLAAATPGTTTKDLMVRMGHASADAALRYQHATRERSTAIAARLDEMIVGAQPEDRSSVIEFPAAASGDG